MHFTFDEYITVLKNKNQEELRNYLDKFQEKNLEHNQLDCGRRDAYVCSLSLLKTQEKSPDMLEKLSEVVKSHANRLGFIEITSCILRVLVEENQLTYEVIRILQKYTEVIHKFAQITTGSDSREYEMLGISHTLSQSIETAKRILDTEKINQIATPNFPFPFPFILLVSEDGLFSWV